MLWLWITVGGIGVVLMALFICFLFTYYSPSRRPPKEEFPLPSLAIYQPYHAVMREWMKQTRDTPCQEVSITTPDGLTLRGRYYEYAPGAPVELMFPGYRGDAMRDLCGGVQRCFALGRSALVVDQRAGGFSDGHIITFGVRESRDCLQWVDYVVSRFGPDVRIILTGISMGATTVLLAAGEPLPPQVAGVLADCGYSNARQIICKVIRQLHLPPRLLYPLVRWGARLFGGFDPDTVDVPTALSRCTLPVFFVHGEADDFVPCEMSRVNYDACPSPKELYTVPGAGHGLAYPAAPEEYLRQVSAFFDRYM